MTAVLRFREVAISPGLQASVALLALALSLNAVAGEYSVSPLRVDLKASHRLEVLTVVNPADAPLAIQVQPVAWSSVDGEDQFADTHELLVTPPIVTIAPHAQQVIRVALRRDADPARELDYRVFITEIPQPPSKDFSGMQIALRMSLPVFVAPPVPEKAELRWSAQWQADGALRITASNQGNAHVKVTDFSLHFKGPEAEQHVSVTRYVLPGSSASWTVKLPEGSVRSQSLDLQGASDRGDFQASIASIGG